MPSKLSEEEIDDILYCARANELSELQECVAEISAKYDGLDKAKVVATAVDADSGNNALHFAGANGLLEITNYLVSLFNDRDDLRRSLVNVQNQSANTPLHWASLNGHLEVVKALLEAGADVTILNKSGYDAVFEAELNDKSAVVDWLLKEAVGVDTGVAGGGGSAETEGEPEAEEEGAEEDVVIAVGKMDLDGGKKEEMDLDLAGEEKTDLKLDGKKKIDERGVV